MLEVLKQRAHLLTSVREFFNQEDVLEVETPVLSSASNPDPYIDLFQTNTLYLQSSPEFAMKRLLAAGSGSIFQICKSFRVSEQGSQHNPEFTMLEWYMLDWGLEALMDQVDRLSNVLFNTEPCKRISYGELFSKQFSVNPHQVSLSELKTLVQQHCSIVGLDALDKDDCLNLLMADVIETNLGLDVPVMVFNYPVSQAALAEVVTIDGDEVALRFELFYKGMELANAYQELRDAGILGERITTDNVKRKVLGKEEVVLSDELVKSISSELPKCSGIAMGLDRVLMLQMEKGNIKEVLPLIL